MLVYYYCRLIIIIKGIKGGKENWDLFLEKSILRESQKSRRKEKKPRVSESDKSLR